MPFLDAHNHLQAPSLAPFLPAILETLERIGIRGAVVNGTIESDWPGVARLARERPWIIPSYGLHPWRISERGGDWLARLQAALDGGGIVGEIGLDRWTQRPDFADQKTVFRAQLQLAAQRNLPATIHCLRAWGPLWDILRCEPVPARGFLLHAYGGPPEMIDGFAGRGAYFSFSASFLAEQKLRKRDTFREIPLHRLLVETDAPSMPIPPALDRYPLPQSPDGAQINHPANIAVAYEGLAELRKIDPAELERITAENFARLFGNF